MQVQFQPEKDKQVKRADKAKLWSWARSIRLATTTDRHLLWELIERSRDGKAYPSHKTLAEALLVSVDTVERSLKRLREAGVILRKLRYAPSGRRTSNCYEFTLSDPKPRAKTSPKQAVKKVATNPQPAGDHYIDPVDSKGRDSTPRESFLTSLSRILERKKFYRDTREERMLKSHNPREHFCLPTSVSDFFYNSRPAKSQGSSGPAGSWLSLNTGRA